MSNRKGVDLELTLSAGGSTTTVGGGLPSLGGRPIGDGHLDSDIGRLYVRTGVLGSSVDDNFNRVNQALLGSTTSSGNKTWTSNGGFAAQIVSNRVSFGNTNNVFGGSGFTSSGVHRFLHGDATGLRKVLAIKFEFERLDIQNYFAQLQLDDNIFAGLSIGRTSPAAILVQGGNGSVTHNLDASYNGLIAGYFSLLFDWDPGTGTYIVSVTHPTTGITTTFTGTRTSLGNNVGRVGVSISAEGRMFWEDLAYYTLGTAAWKPSEPLYLQAQLVSGNVVVANHVLKPGVRVPAASILTEAVLRCDTAPVGASITVDVERFNAGVSQGIIATVSIPTGDTVGSTVGLSAGCAKGDMLRFNVTSVGSTTAGADLTASLDLR